MTNWTEERKNGQEARQNALRVIRQAEIRMLTPPGWSANAENKSVHRTRPSAPPPLVFPASGVCVFVCVFFVLFCLFFVLFLFCFVLFCFVLFCFVSITHRLNDLALLMHLSSTSRSIFQSWLLCMPTGGNLQRFFAQSWLLCRRLLLVYQRRGSTPARRRSARLQVSPLVARFW